MELALQPCFCKSHTLELYALIDNRKDSFEVSRHPYVVDILGELVCRPFLFAILASEVECFDGVAVEGGLFSIDHRIMAVNPHCPVVVRDGEGEDFPVKLLFAFHKSEEFNRTSYCKCYAVSILSIGDIESRSAALHFAR